MLQLGTKESNAGVIEMADFKPETLTNFIRYVYLGYLDMRGAMNAEELFVFTDKYLITKLKEECKSILKKGVSKNNISRST